MTSTIFLQIKTEYTEHLKDILTPFIYEGLKTIYDDAKKMSIDTQQVDKTIIIFQKILQNVPKWTDELITNETIRIKTKSGTSEYFDDLVKAVVKSNIILLTFGNSVSNTIAQTFYDGLKINNFIHRCYIECAKESFNSAYLFYDDKVEIEPIEYKRNQRVVKELIDSALDRAIRKMLPIKSILNEFLINSIPLLQENQQYQQYQQLPKVELVLGNNGQNMGTTIQLNPQLQPTAGVINVPPIAQPQIEKMDIGNPLGNLGEKEKIRELIGLDKVISQTMPDILSPGSRNAINTPTRNSMGGGRSLEIKINPMMLQSSEKPKREGNINFDDDTVKSSSTRKSLYRGGSGLSESVADLKSNDYVEIYDDKGSTKKELDPNKKFFRKS